MSRGWLQALGISESLVEGEVSTLFGQRAADICRVTRKQLATFLSRDGRPQSVWQRWLIEREAFVVFDEFHRGKRLKEWLGSTLPGAAGENDWVPSWLRIQRGRKAKGPIWLLVSATPFNPVELDFQLDAGRAATSEPDDLSAFEARERRVVVNEVHRTLAFVARLGDVRHAHPALERYTEALTQSLRSVDEEQGEIPALPRLPVPVIPGDMSALAPNTKGRFQVEVPEYEQEAVAADVCLLRDVHRCFVAARVPRALAERLLLTGVRARSGRLEGLEYGRTTVQAVRAAQRVVPAIPTKLEAITQVALELSAANKKLLVFCTHRAVAKRLRRHLMCDRRLREGGVLLATSGHTRREAAESQSLAAQFCSADGPMIMVATDAFSESVDLHDHCRHLAHFELPWSPLRVLQRFGRLWRLKGVTTQVPAAMHFIHPGSVEEEILHRLERRWAYLRALGLGYLELGTAIGQRLPFVKWRD
jgi:hypothetical protein